MQSRGYSPSGAPAEAICIWKETRTSTATAVRKVMEALPPLGPEMLRRSLFHLMRWPEVAVLSEE